MSKKLFLKSISTTAAVAASLLLGSVAQAQTGGTAAGSTAGMAGSGTNSPNDASGTPLSAEKPSTSGSTARKPAMPGASGGTPAGMAGSGTNSPNDASGTPLSSSNPPATGAAKPRSGMAKSGGMASDHDASGTVGKTRESSMKNSEKKAAKSNSGDMKGKSGVDSKSAERNSATSPGTAPGGQATTNTR